MQRAIKWALSLLGSIAILCGGFAILHGSLPPASINAWLPAGNLTAARAGAASVLLQDGRLLITGGIGASGALATTDILDPSAGFTAGPAMLNARSNHVAVALLDGRVLVAGGTGADGRASQSAELFDPVVNSWSASGPLMVGRSGATVTLLPSGQVLIAGGTANGAALPSLELFDPNSNTFSLTSGTLSSLRENHAAALLPDGRVLIAGGWDGTTQDPVPPASTGTANVLASTDVFDPSTGTVTPGPALTSPRMNFTATTALDGSVVAIGGTDGVNDLASIDVLVPGAGSFALSGAQLATARQGHLAFLLPHNGNILVVGGTSGGTAVTAVDLYTPWTGATSVTGAMASARSAATGSPLSQMVLTAPVGIEGALIVAGGVDASSPPTALSSAEVYGFATIKTDQSDYPPGAPVTITGSGWQPGEVVQMSLVEVPDLDNDSPIPLTATADENGNIINTEFATDIYDANIHFTLTAVGGVSQAQTTFTDAGQPTVTCSPSPVAVNSQTTCTASVPGQGGSGDTINWSASPTGNGSFSSTTCTINNSNPGTCSVTYTPSAAVNVTITGADGAKSDTFSLVVSAPPSPPTISKTFGAATIALNGSTSLSFTINNPNASALSGVAFTDNLPAGLVVATPNGESGTCGTGTITAVAGSGSVSLSDGTLAASGSCTFSVSVEGTTAGVKNNTTGAITSTEGGTGSTSNTATLTVLGPPTISKSFGASTIPLNGSTSLSFTINNPNASALSGVAFTDTLPAGVVVSTPNGETGACGTGTITAVAGSGSVSLSDGTLAASGSCTFSANTTGTTAGVKNNTTGAITSTEGGTGVASNTATLTVVAPPTISKAFGAASIVVGAPTSLTFTLTNPNSFADLTGVGFSDMFPANVVVASPTGASNTCPAGTFTPVPGAGSVSFSAGTINQGTSCTVSVNVTSFTAGGPYQNTTGAISSANGGTGTASNTASLTVNPADTATTVTSNLNPSIFGQTVTFIARVRNSSAGSTATPTAGTITFTIDGTPVAGTILGACPSALPPYSLCASYSTDALTVPGSPHSVSATYANADGNFNGSIGSLTGGQVVNPATAVASVTVTPLYFNGNAVPTSGPGPTATYPAPANCSGVTGPCQQYSDEVNFTVVVSPGSINNVYPLDPVNTCVVADDDVPCVKVRVAGANALQGFKDYGPIPLSLDNNGNLVGELDNQQILQMPGPYTATVVPISTVDPNFILNATTGRGSLTVVQEDAAANYTGQTDFEVPPTSTTVNVTVSYTLQDATATGTDNSFYDPWAGDITKAKVAVTLSGTYVPSGGGSGNFNGSCAAPLAVAAVPGETDPTNHLPSTGTITCVIQNVPVNGNYNLIIAPGTGSYYLFWGDTNLNIATSNDGAGFITGGGFQKASSLTSVAGLLTPAARSKMNFGFVGKYNKKGSNLQGSANIIIRTDTAHCLAPGFAGSNYSPQPGNDGLCVYQIKGTSVQTLNEALTPTPPSAYFTIKANIQDVTWPTPQSIDGNLLLQLWMYDVAEPGANVDTLSIQINDGNKGLFFFSNNWSGTQTAISPSAPVINGGNLQVH